MCSECLDFIPMTEEDIPALVPIMKRAFEDDARRYGRLDGGPEGYDDGEFLRKRIVLPDVEGYRINLDGKAIGAILLFVHPEQASGHLSCIFIDPTQMGKGCGAAAWQFVERTYPQIRTWTLNTSAVSYRNHCFYINKLGFQVVAVDGGDDPHSALFQLTKNLGGK